MNKHRLSVLLLLLILTGLGVLNAQSLGDGVYVSKAENKTFKHTNKKQGFDPKVDINIGSSFSSFAPGYNLFGTYIMPEVTIPVNKKFAFRAGIGYSSIFSNLGMEGSIFDNKPQSYGTVYFESIYKLNEKVTISAVGYKTFNLQPHPQNEKLNPHALDMSNEGVYFNMNYRVSDKFEINAGFSYDNRHYNPYGFPQFGATPVSGWGSGFHNPAMRQYSPF